MDVSTGADAVSESALGLVTREGPRERDQTRGNDRLRPGNESQRMTCILTLQPNRPTSNAPPRGPRWDALAPDEPRASLSLCYISSALSPREALFAPEGEGAAAGGEGAPAKTFTQADVDRIVQDRVGKLNERIKAQDTQLARLAEIEKKLAEADEREAKAREEAELKGKSELEKLQIQIQKSTEAAKKAEADWQKKLAEVETQKTHAEKRFLDHVTRSAVSDALSLAGVVKTGAQDAALSFLSSAQIELDEGHKVKTVVVGGRSFDNPVEAAKHFLAEKPHFAEAPPGGSGNPRNGTGAPPGARTPTTVAGLLTQGLVEMGRTG